MIGPGVKVRPGNKISNSTLLAGSFVVTIRVQNIKVRKDTVKGIRKAFESLNIYNKLIIQQEWERIYIYYWRLSNGVIMMNIN